LAEVMENCIVLICRWITRMDWSYYGVKSCNNFTHQRFTFFIYCWKR